MQLPCSPTEIQPYQALLNLIASEIMKHPNFWTIIAICAWMRYMFPPRGK